MCQVWGFTTPISELCLTYHLNDFSFTFFWGAWFYCMLHFGQRSCILRRERQYCTNISLYYHASETYPKNTHMIEQNSGKLTTDPCRLMFDAVNTGATLPKTPVCILLCQLLSLQNCTSLRKRLQSRKVFFPKGCPEGIWSSIVHQPQSRLRTLREHWAILMLNAHFVIAEEQSY